MTSIMEITIKEIATECAGVYSRPNMIELAFEHIRRKGCEFKKAKRLAEHYVDEIISERKKARLELLKGVKRA